MSGSAVPRRERGRLGESLIQRGVLTEAQLNLALKEKSRIGGHIGEVLVSLGFVSEEELSSALAEQSGVAEINLLAIKISPEALKLLEEDFCRKHMMLPISVDKKSLRVAMSNTFDVLAVDAASRVTKRSIDVVAAPERAMLEALDRAFGGGGDLAMEILISEATEATRNRSEIVGLISEQPVVRLVEAIFIEGVRREATDIHIEPEERLVRCRYRIDGVLVQGPILPDELRSAVVARVKLLASMDISETRLPQDGKIVNRLDRRHINMRVSSMPSVHGENVVVRILDRNRLALGLEELGFSADNLKVLAEAIERPSGIILVTGPTGSGKTTTLYAALSAINSLERKIATLEDPIEYELPVVRQAQINLRAGLTFGVGLRALLRQDPDVILVGEMRDRETAEVALRAAMTGHLVMSTLHTSSAAGTIPRLLDMGMEPYLVASTLIAIVAQRLVRQLCPHCCEKETAPDSDKLRLLGIAPSEAGALYRPGKCEECHGTGYQGRRAVVEVLRVSPALARLIAKSADSATIAEAARREGMTLMEGDAREMVLVGKTSLEEALRQTWGSGFADEPEPLPTLGEVEA